MSTELQVLQASDGFSLDQQKLLQEKLKEHDIKERPGAGGKKLKYVSGDYAIATANRIFGYGKWGYRVLSKSREQVGEKEFYTADIELYVIGCPFPFPGEGVGVPQNSTIEQHEKARKEAVTDALKRALRHYGDQFGLSLYNEDNYIEANDGSEKQVKDVGKANGNRPALKVVDAQPAQQSDTIDAPVPSKLRAMFRSIGTTLDTAQKMTFGTVKPDDYLTPEECFRLQQVYDAWKKRFDEKASTGAGK